MKTMSKIGAIGLVIFVIGMVVFNGYLGTRDKKEDTKGQKPPTTAVSKQEVKETSESSTSHSTAEEAQNQTHDSANQVAANFIQSYTTYKEYGDNFSSYSIYLSDKLKGTIEQQLQNEINQTNIQQLGSSVYKSSELYTNQLSEDKEKIIARIVSSVTSGGKENDSDTTLILTLEKDKSNEWLIVSMQPIRITENYYS